MLYITNIRGCSLNSNKFPFSFHYYQNLCFWLSPFASLYFQHSCKQCYKYCDELFYDPFVSVMVTSLTWTTVQCIVKQQRLRHGAFCGISDYPRADSLMPNWSLILSKCSILKALLWLCNKNKRQKQMAYIKILLIQSFSTSALFTFGIR